MDFQSLFQLCKDVAEVACFDARGRCVGVSVHGVALPDGDVAGFLDGSDMVWEVVGDFGGAVAGD